MKIAVVILVIMTSAKCFAFAATGMTARFEFSSLHSIESQSELKQAFERAYRYVTSTVPDRSDRKQCPILVRFVPLSGVVGRAISKSGQCQDIIEMDENLTASWAVSLNAVHELAHILRSHYNKNEDLWVFEGVAKLMEVLFVGAWPYEMEEQLHGMKQVSISNQLDDYNARREGSKSVDGPGTVTSFFLMHYLYSHFGRQHFLRALFLSPKSGWMAIESVLQKLLETGIHPVPSDFLSSQSLFRHFAMAVIFNVPSVVDYRLFYIDEQFTPLSQPLRSVELSNVHGPKTILHQTSGLGSVRHFVNHVQISYIAEHSNREIYFFNRDRLMKSKMNPYDHKLQSEFRDSIREWSAVNSFGRIEDGALMIDLPK